MRMTGPKLGWLLGGLGSLLWLLILAGIWASQDNWLGAVLGVLICLVGAAYLLAFAPWRFPRTPLRRLMLGFVVIFLVGVAVAFWQYREAMTAGHGLPLVALFTLLVPGFTLGRRSWSDLHGEWGG